MLLNMEKVSTPEDDDGSIQVSKLTYWREFLPTVNPKTLQLILDI
jgi:hypothetical protein